MNTPTTLAALLLFAAPASALPTTADWLLPGDGLLTRSSGLDWLDASETLGRSYADVVSDPQLAGFRHASLGEVHDLLLDAGIDAPISVRPDIYDAYKPSVLTLDLVGVPARGEWYGIFGLTEEGIFGSVWVHPGYNLADICLGNCHGYTTVHDDVEANRTRSGIDRYGHWMVRAVPEPSTVLLVALGLVGIAARRIRVR